MMAAVEMVSTETRMLDYDYTCVRSKPMPWRAMHEQRIIFNKWLEDNQSEEGLTGFYTITMGPCRSDPEYRYLFYFFSDPDTAFKFKLRWC